MQRCWNSSTQPRKHSANARFSAWLLFCTLCLFVVSVGLATAATTVPSLILTVPDLTLQEAQQHPQSLVRDAVQLELAHGYGKRPYLRYRFHKVTEHLDRTQEILETKDGDIACLIATNGNALTTDAAQAERSRLVFLRAHPALQAHRRRREQEDILHFETILRALPDAFQFRFASIVPTTSGPEVHLTFQPNPHYKSTEYETHALSGMRGDIWIDARQKRIVNFDARLFRPVSFGLGILGYLDKGGTIRIQQSEVVPSVWSLTKMDLSISGRALLVKPLQFDVQEIATEYRLNSEALHFQQAIDLLVQDHCGLDLPSTQVHAQISIAHQQ